MIRAFQWDLARQVERLDWLLALLPRYAEWGFGELYLHLEDAVHYPSLPGLGRADAYTHGELSALVAAAKAVGIGVVPIANLLGHTQYLIKHPAWRDLNELRAPDGSPLEAGQICPLHPRTLEVAEALFADLAPFCTAGKIHVGLDESFHLGKHPLSRAEIAARGLAAHFAGHVQRLHALAAKRGLQLGYWADMLYFIPDAIPLLPPGSAAYDWYYYPFAGHPRVELYNFAARDLEPALRRQGIDYWGCPMNGAFRHEPLPIFGERLANIRSWWKRCQKKRATGILITSWESSRLAAELPVVIDAAASCLWDKPGATSAEQMLAHGFKVARVVPNAPGLASSAELPSSAFTTSARTALALDRLPFSGYARWQLNTRWDTTADGPDHYLMELGHLQKLGEQPGLPTALVASLAFRAYLAERDVFVRECACSLRRLRKKPVKFQATLAGLIALAEIFRDETTSAASAAAFMWSRTRAGREGPNHSILSADWARVTRLLRWLKSVRRDPKRINLASPVLGAAELCFVIDNFAPALQKVVVDAQGRGGSWTRIHEQFTIEFRASAARPRALLLRKVSVPVPPNCVKVRIGVQGIGQIRIRDIRLAEKRVAMPAKGFGPKRSARFASFLLGRPAPQSGFPVPDWTRNSGEIAIDAATRKASIVA